MHPSIAAYSYEDMTIILYRYSMKSGLYRYRKLRLKLTSCTFASRAHSGFAKRLAPDPKIPIVQSKSEATYHPTIRTSSSSVQKDLSVRCHFHPYSSFAEFWCFQLGNVVPLQRIVSSYYRSYIHFELLSFVPVHALLRSLICCVHHKQRQSHS